MNNRLESTLPMPAGDQAQTTSSASPATFVRDRVTQATKRMEKAILARPGTSLAVAALAGAAAGWILKRK